MTVTLTQQKKEHLKELITEVLTQKFHTIKRMAQVIATMIAYFPSSKFGPLYYRNLDLDKTRAMKEQAGRVTKITPFLRI